MISRMNRLCHLSSSSKLFRLLAILLAVITLYFLIANYNSWNDIKISCRIYNEMKDYDFNNNRVRLAICSNGVSLYKKQSNGQYPLCQLSQNNTVIHNLLEQVRQHSVFTYLTAEDKRNKIPIYTYPDEDLISRDIIRNHDWENTLSTRLAAVAKSIGDATLVDIGSNIGVFTLQAMRLNLSTVSVDANIRNLLRLRLSLLANNQNINDRPLIWNFMANKSQLMAISMPRDCNIGGSGYIGSKNDFYQVDTIKTMPAMPEELSRLIKTKNIVMKLDIEGGEPEFLRNSEALFTKFQFPVVTVEFLIKDEFLVSFFTAKHFQPFNPYAIDKDENLKQLDIAAWKSWPTDIWWINKNFKDEVMKTLQSKNRASIGIVSTLHGKFFS